MKMPSITAEHIRFLGIFFLAFFITSAFLYSIDFVPESPSAPVTGATSGTDSETNPHELPLRVVIEKIGVDTSVSNPEAFSIAALDQALLAGAVRYPGSALLGEDATVFLFGHQSYLPVVRNQAFKAFNGLQRLSSGDAILIYGDDGAYEYEVESVLLVNAEDALIPLETGEQKLVLSTCNSFGDPGERYVVTARFISKVAEDGA